MNPTTGNPIAGTGDAYNGVVIPGSGWPDAAKGRVPIADYRRIRSPVPRRAQAATRTSRRTSSSPARSRLSDRTRRLWFVPASAASPRASASPTRSSSAATRRCSRSPRSPTASPTTPAAARRASFPLSINTQDKIFKNPEAYNWNATVERELGFKTVLEVSYVGRKGLHGQRERNINQLLAGHPSGEPRHQRKRLASVCRVRSDPHHQQ